jgi:kinesin family protein 1
MAHLPQVPHLVNLAEDPLADGCLLWMIKPGKTTVGNVDSSEGVDIRLTGDNVLPLHCYFETLPDGSVQLTALADSTTMVNGQRIGSDKVCQVALLHTRN